MSEIKKKIDDIESIRKTNNSRWMDILRIAIKHAPDETKKVLNDILENDRVISHKVECIVKEIDSKEG